MNESYEVTGADGVHEDAGQDHKVVDMQTAMNDCAEGPQSLAWTQRYMDVHTHVFGKPLRVMDHGKGVHLWDVDGNEYLDFLAGIAVNALGYAHPQWVDAVSRQAGQMAHISNYFASRQQIELAERLVRISGAPQGSHVYFANSGTEANEAALKLSKLYGRTLPKSGSADKPVRVIGLTHGFHGRTLGSLGVTWKPDIREPYDPLVPGFGFVPAGDVDALRSAFDEDEGTVAAVILEVIQGEAGVCPLGPDYISAVRRICDEHRALMIIDEVQTGIGRTGSWFAFQQPSLSGGVTPDIVTFAKGIASGFPMGGMVVFGKALSDLFGPGLHGSTFAGGPLACTAALTTLDVIENDNLIDNVNSRSKQLQEGIAKCGNPLFTEVRGAGLLLAVELAHPCSHAVMAWLLDHGLIVNAVSNDALRLAPPLIVGEQDVDDALRILAQVPGDLEDD